MIERDSAAVDALRIAVREYSWQSSGDWFSREKMLAEIYRSTLSPEERVRWRETWLDIALKGQGYASLCANTLVRTFDNAAIEPLVQATLQGKLETRVALEALEHLLEIGHPSAIGAVRAVLA